MLKLTAVFVSAFLLAAQTEPADNGLFQINPGKSLLDAHNCYPYDGKWENRLDRALSTGFPVGIEQDIAPYLDPRTHEVVAKVTHREKADASEPTLKQHFFDRVRPIVERALREKKTENWPLIVLHFDFKDNSVSTLEAVWKVLGEYQDWITTAPKTKTDAEFAPFDLKPLLVLTEDNDTQEQVFYRRLAVGDKLRLFGSARTNQKIFQGLNQQQKNYALAHASPDLLLTSPATNYRRWWNNSWWEVEEGGQQAAGDWTEADNQRLKALVDHAHRLGYWIRFYTLDGFTPSQDQGWGTSYNFGSRAAVDTRWRAAIDAGVNMIATDQYEALRAFMREKKASLNSAPKKI
jgi:hypothetical protein